MKKIMYTLVIVAAANAAYAQGFLKKVKAKVTQAVEQPVVNQAPAGMGSGIVTNDKWTNPATCGTVVKTFSDKEISDHMGGFDIWFPYVRVVNNQLQLQVADWSTTLYNYTNGKLVAAGTPPNVDRNALKNGNEQEFMSVNFTQEDQTNAILKKGQHVSNGNMPGKPMQSLVFKGKPVGDFMMYQIAHNADSSVVVVMGASISGGLKYSLVNSAGKTLPLPVKTLAQPLVSPDGKFSAAWVGQNDQAYLSDGTIVKTTPGVFPEKLWLRNTGGIFCLVDNHTSTLYRNGEVYRAFNLQMKPNQLFISKDDKSMCWEGDHGLYFSDGTAFENGSSPHKVIIDGKEVMVFLTVNMTTGQVYLCKKDL